MQRRNLARGAITALFAAQLAGCYRFAFEQGAASAPSLGRGGGPPAQTTRTVTYTERVPTYLNGFVGTGRVNTQRYCADPLRTDLRVTATDVLVSVATLLIYTPHTLSVTCAETTARQPAR